MAKFIGDQNQLGFTYESGTYANSSGTLQWIGQVQNFSPDESAGVIPVRYQGAGDRNVDQFVDGPLDFTGTFTYFPQDWKFLMFTLGSNVDAGSPSPYTHTISETNSDDGNAFTSGTTNPFISFGLEASQKAPGTGQNFIRTFQGCVVNTMTISASQGDIISVDVDFVAQSGTFSSGAPSSLTPTTTRPFLWSDVKLHIPSGTVYEEMTDFTLTINNNLEAPHYLNGSRVISTPIPLNRDYELSVTLHATSERTKTLYEQYFMGGSTFNCMLEINAETGSRDAYIILSGCKLMDMDSPEGMEGVNEQTLTIQPKTAVVEINDTIERYNPW